MEEKGMNVRTVYKYLRYKRILEIHDAKFSGNCSRLDFWRENVFTEMVISFDVYKRALRERKIVDRFDMADLVELLPSKKSDVLKNQLKLEFN